MTWATLSAAVILVVCGIAGTSRSLALEVASPEWREAVAEAREVSELSERIDTMRLKISILRARYGRARRYHENRKESLKIQIAIRERQLKIHGNNATSMAEYRAAKETQYKYRMCALLMDAFFFDKDHEDRLKVLYLCIGRTSMALAQGAASTSTPALRGNVSNVADDPEPNVLVGPSLLEALEEQIAEGKVLLAEVAKLQGPAAESLHRRLDALEQEYEATAQELRADKVRWKAEIDELNEREQRLGDAVVGGHYDRQAVNREAWQNVKNDFCPVINQWYSIDNDKIVDHAIDKCS